MQINRFGYMKSLMEGGLKRCTNMNKFKKEILNLGSVFLKFVSDIFLTVIA